MDSGEAAGFIALVIFLSVLGFFLTVVILRWIFRVNEILAELRTISAHAVYQGEMLNYISEQMARDKEQGK